MAPVRYLGAALLLALATSAPSEVAVDGVANVGGSRWAVIAVGSSGYYNYRHHADACHAYQVLLKSGVPEDHIILMMEDDVANDSENPFPGKLYNKPGMDSPDVYHGCKPSYKGSVVTAALFLAVITGDKAGVPHGGPVLQSGPNDHVFLNFVDHGGVGIVAFPNGPYLHVRDLSKALEKMQQQKMFNELVFYMEACEAGSMFPNLNKVSKILSVTASNAHESSWGTYCGPDAKVNGKDMDTCLGDLFSVSWMEDADRGMFGSETIKQQVKLVTNRTSAKSHVTIFGDDSVEKESIGRFYEQVEAYPGLVVAAPLLDDSMDVRDIPLRSAFAKWSKAVGHAQKQLAWEKLSTIVAARKADEKVFEHIVQEACRDALLGCSTDLKASRLELQDLECHKTLADSIHEDCPRRAPHNSGGWNGFSMKFSQTLVNICERRQYLGKDVGALAAIVKAECAEATAEVRVVAATEIVV